MSDCEWTDEFDIAGKGPHICGECLENRLREIGFAVTSIIDTADENGARIDKLEEAFEDRKEDVERVLAALKELTDRIEMMGGRVEH